jgi:hypothetical protein
MEGTSSKAIFILAITYLPLLQAIVYTFATFADVARQLLTPRWIRHVKRQYCPCLPQLTSC